MASVLEVGASLAPGLVLVEDLGHGRGWLARDGETFLRVYPRADLPELAKPLPASPFLVPPAREGEGWVAYPYLRATLADRLGSRGPLPLAEALARVLEVLAGIDALQGAGRRHTGLTLETVGLCETGEARIFGLEAELPEAHQAAFRAPEQRGRVVPTPQAEIYMAGALFYALITGRPPAVPARPPCELAPELPGWIDRVALMALDPDPGHRFPAVQVYRAALGAAQNALQLRQANPDVSTSRPAPHPFASAGMGPSSPLGRWRPGGLRPVEVRAPGPSGAGDPPAAPLQDRVGISGPEPAAPAEVPGRAVGPRYVFSLRRTLLVGLPFLAFCAGVLWLMGQVLAAVGR